MSITELLTKQDLIECWLEAGLGNDAEDDVSTTIQNLAYLVYGAQLLLASAPNKIRHRNDAESKSYEIIRISLERLGLCNT